MTAFNDNATLAHSSDGEGSLQTLGAGPANDHQDQERDSGISDVDDQISTTTSISTLFREQLNISKNGRRYPLSPFDEGKEFLLPNDEQEQQRLDMQHKLIAVLMTGNSNSNGAALLSPPQQLAYGGLVLDVGTGTGIWAMDFADEHPNMDVMGSDITPIQPHLFVTTLHRPSSLRADLFRVPNNCTFVVDDLEQPWDWAEQFNLALVFCRCITGSFKDPRYIFRQSFSQLEPGGRLEIQDFDLRLQHCGRAPTTTKVQSLLDALFKKSEETGLCLDCVHEYRGMMAEIGYEDIQEKKYYVPLGGRWPREELYKQVGWWASFVVVDFLEALCLELLVGRSGWTVEEVDVLFDLIRAELQDHHYYITFYTLSGRKPGSLSTIPRPTPGGLGAIANDLTTTKPPRCPCTKPPDEDAATHASKRFRE